MSSLRLVVAVGLLCFVQYGSGSGEFVVLHSPPSLKFTGREALRESVVKEVYSAALGFTVEHGSNWAGLTIDDPFNVPQGAVQVSVEGVASLGSKGHLKGQKYPLITDSNELNTWESMQRRITMRFPEGGNRLASINLSDGPDAVNEYYDNIFGGDIKVPKVTKSSSLKYLKPAVNDEDYQFLQDLELLKAISAKVASGAITPDNKADFFYITLESLHPLSDLHGADSPATAEAKTLLSDALQKLSDDFKNAYDGSVLVTAVASDASHTRRTRSILETATAAKLQELNLAKTYTANFPVIFNIIFWFTVVLILTLVAVSYTIADMDPGRDSIIYRMTSNRMKKEN